MKINFLTGIFKKFSIIQKVVSLLFIVFLVVGLWNVYKPLPEGFSREGRMLKVKDEDVIFLSDETYTHNGERVISQSIFDYVFSMIKHAEDFILVDMFLWNSFGDEKQAPYRKLSEELSAALIKKKNENPSIQIIVISDPLNSSYGGHPSPHFEAMKAAGISVVFTNLVALRDSNPIYSVIWRTFVYPFDRLHMTLLGKEYTLRLLPSILGAQENVTLRSYLHLLNFKANHRKLIVADARTKEGGQQIVSLVTSANPHNGSSAHSNVAVVVVGSIWKDILISENSVITSAGKIIPFMTPKVEEKESGDVLVQLVTEKKIQDKALTMIQSTKPGDQIQLFMFYLSDRTVLQALKEAALRGVDVSIILDPNKDAFGREKNGVPNRSVAHELVAKTDGKIRIRFCATTGEQCHTKLLVVTRPEGSSMLVGSANYTRRNISNYNLETNIFVSGISVSAITQAKEYFQRAWDNEDSKTYTLPYSSFEDTTLKHRIMWKFMEATGIGTF